METITDTEVVSLIKPDIYEERQIIIHCCFPATPFSGSLIRVWPSTFLIDYSNNHKSKLLHAENISIYPNWTEVLPFKDYWFMLIFEGLPKNCSTFDLQEIIPEEGGFWVKDIARNQTDIYRVLIS